MKTRISNPSFIASTPLATPRRQAKRLPCIAMLAAAFALLVSTAHAAPIQLTTNAATDSLPHWHPTNNKIVYGRYTGSGATGWDVASVNTDGTGETLIGTGLVLNGYHNALGWVGNTNTVMVAETVFFHELLAFDTTQAPAARTTSDGNQGTVFTRKLLVPGGNNSNVMIVSRDGTRMVWRDTVNASTNIQIRTALYSSLSGQNTDTHGTLVLSSTNSGTGTRGMALTANGDTLVISIVTGSNFELWRYSTSGGAGTQLTSDATASSGNINPSISPDGTKILWQRFTATDSDVWMMNLDGTDKVNITQTATFSEGAPTWAPDGVQYAFAGGDGNLYKDSVPVAAQPPGATVTIDFNDFPVGLLAGDALAGYGIPSVTFGGTGPGAAGMRIHDNTGSNHVIPSPPKLMAQDGNSNDPNLTHFLRFNFTPQLTAFSLKRTGKNGGGSTDTWRAYFYNAAGTLLGDFGESTPIINAPVTTFSFTAPVGQTIARMDLVSIWTGFATNRNIPVDDFALTRATGSPTNAAPTATNLSAAETYIEDTPLDLVNIVVSDVDSANVTVTLTLSDTSAGSLSTGSSGAVTSTYTTGTGVWTASGAIANVNTLLAGVTFTPAANFNSSFMIATDVSDGSLSVTGSKAVTGTAVNDAPVLDTSRSPAFPAVNEDALAPSGTGTGMLVSDLVDFAVPSGQVDNVTDVDDGALLGIAVTATDTSSGNWWYTVNGGVTWLGLGSVSGSSARLLAAHSSTRLYFQPAPNFSGSLPSAITFRAWDRSSGSNGGTASTTSNGDATAFSSATDTVSIVVTAVNDAPLVTNRSADETYIEDTPLDLINIVVSDVDSANVTATLTLSNPSAGSLSTGTSGAVTSTYTAGTGVWTASGAIANVNALLAGVIFTPALNFNSNFTIATRVSDGGPNVTGSKDMTGTAVNDMPVVTLTGENPRTVEAAASYADLGATATDVEDGVLTPTITSNTVVANVPGSYSVTWTATDSGAVPGSATRTVNVVDTTPPFGGTFTVSPSSPVMAGALLTGNFAGWMDAAGGALTYSVRLGAVVIVPPGTDATPDFMLPAGTHLLTGRVFDGAGNFTDVGPVSVTVDGMAPTLTLPANITTEAVDASGAAVSFMASASDDLDPNPVVLANPPSGSLFPIGLTTVNVTATDTAGNQSAGSFTVTMQDTTPPVISGVPANIVVEAGGGIGGIGGIGGGGIGLGAALLVGGGGGTVVTFASPTALDLVDGSVPVMCSPPSGSTFPIGTTTVTCTASDTRMNTSSASFTVTVQDTTGPVFTTVPPPQSDTASAGTGTAPVPDIVSLAEATDAVGVVSITQSPMAGTELPPGLHNIRLTAKDAEDNEGIADVPFTVHVAPEAVDDVGFASKVVIFIDVLANDSLPAGSIITDVSTPSRGQARIENGKVRYTPPSTGLITSTTFTYTAGVEPDLDTATVTVRPMADAVGTFVGLLQRTDSTVRGRVLLTVASTGGMTGSVRFEGRSFPARGAVNGTSLALTGALPKPVPAVLDRGAPDVLGQPTFIVTLPDSVPGQTLTATAERSPYKATNPAPQAGRYTIIADLPVGGSGPETAAALSCVVANDGKVTFGGKFSAAIAVTQAGKVLHGGRLPFFVSKGTGATMQGLGGELVFDPSGSPDVTGTLRWNVPAGTAKLAAGVAQDYDAIGQLYVPPALASGMFSPAVPTATLTLTAPSLGASSPLVRVLSLTTPPVNGLRNISFPGGFINLRVNTGLFTGTCTLSGSRGFFGAVLRGSPTNAGQGTLLDTTSLQPVTFVP